MSTGIVRRIDELGRIVIPKEIRKSLRIKNGDNLEILVEGDTKDIFQRVDFLSRNKINIPEIVEFTYLAKKKKNVSIDYHSDIRDIIKDIYKHV